MHKIRRLRLFAAIESTINGGVLFVTGLGRNIDNRAYEKHRRYQPNSIKNRNVLSNKFIKLRAYKDKQLKLLKTHWKAAIDELNTLIAELQASFQILNFKIRGDLSGQGPQIVVLNPNFMT